MARGGLGRKYRQDILRADLARYDGNRAVRKLSSAAQYQVMAFAESLRDIEACLSAQTAKLYHMGFETGSPSG
jgi:hypothetical protein